MSACWSGAVCRLASQSPLASAYESLSALVCWLSSVYESDAACWLAELDAAWQLVHRLAQVYASGRLLGDRLPSALAALLRLAVMSPRAAAC
jgi:hypothetical protein